ncbi:MAG TPA: DNA-binding response regulator [Methanothrix sp.]|uniref:DNA-binding response regulator n=1 Tax=Methanothrix sp. TaxID=90426 RepID=UPI002BD1B0EA|nr:DNA-binding response regulator [Methanothrix sp.]MDI9418364.1 DNA-binding response regulator [Euryarchaeota archaeon]HON35079.1 DNA-binding response regulator [Methanothrix sp.]HRU75465.1 DNA-binding response regulator [Methanothrix sp.]
MRDLVLKIGATTKVVEKQATRHGSLRGSSEIEQALLEVVREMIKQYNIQTKLTPEQLSSVVRLFYKGLSDTEIAEQLGDRALNKTVSRARIKLHLFRETDLKPPFDKEEFIRLTEACRSVKDMAEALRVAPSTISEYRNIFDSQKASERDGYTKRFLEILSDQDVSERMVTVHTEDGLQDTIDTDYEAAEA